MNAKKRRVNIINALRKSQKPIKGTDLAKKFDVSRQVIVQDVAILRAAGEEIIATPQGYMILSNDNKRLIKTIVSKHVGYSSIEDELKIIVDNGCKVLDVIVEHPLYGEIKSPLMIGSRKDIEEFMKNMIKTKAEPLSSLTDGVHIHTIEIPSKEAYEKTKIELKRKKYLIDNK